MVLLPVVTLSSPIHLHCVEKVERIKVVLEWSLSSESAGSIQYVLVLPRASDSLKQEAQLPQRNSAAAAHVPRLAN